MRRKKPYSGKQKKLQLQQYKQKQREEQQRRDEQLKREYEQRQAPQAEEPDTEKEEFASRRVISARGRLVTMLQLETNEEVARRKRDATRPLNLQRLVCFSNFSLGMNLERLSIKRR